MEKIDTKILTAVTVGRNVLIAETTPLDFLHKVLHEAGHVLAREVSFSSGHVLTPLETRTHTVPLTATQRGWLESEEFHRTDSNMTPKEVASTASIAAMAIAEFAKGNFDPSNLTINYGVDFADFFRGSSPVTVHVRNQRRVELPAYFTQIGGLNILRGSLPNTGPRTIENPSLPEFLPHRGALRVVYAAYQHDWMVPSMIDRRPLAA